jgi:uncharacterized membrane protein YfcA
VFIGAWVRITYLPDPVKFKLFAGVVLGYIGFRLLATMVSEKRQAYPKATESKMSSAPMTITDVNYSGGTISFRFEDTAHSFSVTIITILCLLVGVIGGIYGIGGGAIIAPVLVTFFGLPVYAVAGAALMGTFITSVAGVLFFQLLALFYPDLTVAPDFLLGTLFGVGGLVGMYCGARCQRYVPALLIKLVLFFSVMFVAVSYIATYVKAL